MPNSLTTPEPMVLRPSDFDPPLKRKEPSPTQQGQGIQVKLGQNFCPIFWRGVWRPWGADFRGSTERLLRGEAAPCGLAILGTIGTNWGNDREAVQRGKDLLQSRRRLANSRTSF